MPGNLGVYGQRNVHKALRCLELDNPLSEFSEKTGPKTRAFYACLVDPENVVDVCIDRHAASAALGRRGSRGGSAVERIPLTLYRWIARHYVAIAKRVGLAPHQVQAIIWSVWRSTTPGHEVELF